MYGASQSLIFTLADGSLVGYNFLQKTSFEFSPDLFDILACVNNTPEEEAYIHTDVGCLEEFGVIVRCGSHAEKLDEDYASRWKWGLPAALFHFSVQGNSFASSVETEEKQIVATAISPSPPLFDTNDCYPQQFSLPKVNLHSGPLDLMARRRTVRQYTGRVLAIEELSDILFSGMGITSFTKNCVCDLPLSMTPSGGARNPYEAYVFARNVDGLESGTYHYSATEHSLGRLAGLPADPLGALAGNQDWVDDAACLIVLCAHFERTMWKYDDPNAYRVVLIEAGHIGQNMMLAGTSHKQTVCATAALTHDLLYKTLNIQDRITIAPIYAFAVGEPKVDAHVKD